VMSGHYKPLGLRSLKLENNIFLAPMAGYTDRAARRLALLHGAGLAFTEMVSCEGLRRLSAKTEPLMKRAEGEANLAVQLFAGNIEALERSLPLVLKEQPQLIDFNCGCPVSKVVKSGSGSALMKEPELFRRMMRTLRQNVPADIPVSVKFRSGWDSEHINFLEIAGRALAEGIDMLTMHPRTRSQAYSGRADYNRLALLKRHFPEAVICGSGDLMQPEDVGRMFETTGVDAVMIARGSIGNPFIFRQIKEYLLTGRYNAVHSIEKLETALLHLEWALEYGKEEVTVREIKKHIMSYPKAVEGSSRFRQECAVITDSEAFRALIKLYIEQERRKDAGG
jgi:tRNA-dihydrouridine synthase B